MDDLGNRKNGKLNEQYKVNYFQDSMEDTYLRVILMSVHLL